ncbi:MAG: heavy metal sensor signal transduction histidine kinase [Actinomycetia bacterium]|nr:heavy metal sensor signal transduction histidine kinase [Actinomycetes bacterium]
MADHAVRRAASPAAGRAASPAAGRHGTPPWPTRWLGRWWRRRGLRARVTITAAAALLVAFAVFDLLLFSVLRVSLTRSLDDSAGQSASEVVALINANRLPDPIPVAPEITVQVLDPAGHITDVSPGADRLVPLLSGPAAAAAAAGRAGQVLNGSPFDMPSLLRVDAARAADGSLVIAAVPYISVSDSLTVVARALTLGTPVLFALFTWVIWVAAGLTLRPVGALRRGAARITATGVPRPDLPVPEARDEIRELALTLNDMLSRLAAAQQRQRALVSDTAHELRSPIASIRAQLEVALDHPSRQDWAATARDVHADTLRLAKLAEDLLLLAWLDERAAGGSPGQARHVPVDLVSLAQEAAARYAAARVPVTIDVPLPAAEAAEVLVPGHRDGLDRLLVNLLDNAVRYAASRVTVVVRSDGEWAELTVTDDGPGIPAGDVERAFDRFARLDSARSRDGDEPGGAGLGLAIVRATAQAHGGTAHLEPAPAGSGLRAVVRLRPLARAVN